MNIMSIMLLCCKICIVIADVVQEWMHCCWLVCAVVHIIIVCIVPVFEIEGIQIL